MVDMEVIHFQILETLSVKNYFNLILLKFFIEFLFYLYNYLYIFPFLFSAPKCRQSLRHFCNTRIINVHHLLGLDFKSQSICTATSNL